jgi:Na+/melibiose symporter-like transporter
MESQNQNDDEKTLVMTMISAYAVGLVLGILAFYLVFKGMGKKTSAFLKSGLGLGASILVFFPASYMTFFLILMTVVANAGEENYPSEG